MRLDNLAVDLSAQGYIGYLVMYSVSARYIEKLRFDRAFLASSLPLRFKPKPPRDIDAYKFAMNLLKDEWNDRSVYEDENRYTRVLIRPIRGEYKVVLEDVSKVTGKKLSYRECIYIRVEHTRDDFRFWIEWEDRPTEHEETLEEIAKEITRLYSEVKNSYISSDIRQVVYEILRESRSIKVRQNGAVYFVPVEFEEYVLGLDKLFEKLREEGCFVEFRHFPVINQPKYRNQILDKFYEELSEIISRCKKEYVNLLEKYRDKQIPPSLRARIVKKLQNAMELAKYYEEHLKSQADMQKKMLEEFIKTVMSGKPL